MDYLKNNSSSVYEGESIRIRGMVQGVGFRPAVWRFARECGLTGEVLNDGEGFLIRVWGQHQELDRFVNLINHESPALARIDHIERKPIHEPCPRDDFKIVESNNQSVQTGITPDSATCLDCLEETLNPSSRRYRYPFTNCSHCGPRFSIVSALPYDRAHTSMAEFTMCDACKAEYSSPIDRRFHAQPIACPACGPKVWLERSDGCATQRNAIDEATTLLQQGKILAIKGIGGFHLACDATNKGAVEKLRQRKQRYGKPLALMAKNIEVIGQYCSISKLEKSLLKSSAAPIVLLSAKGKQHLPDSVAPGMNTYGFMLPCTPLQHLIFSSIWTGPLSSPRETCPKNLSVWTIMKHRTALRILQIIFCCMIGILSLEVQHHHAHIAACMAENNMPLSCQPILGVALDGSGYGDDESLWRLLKK